jgi:hypothetical protein
MAKSQHRGQLLVDPGFQLRLMARAGVSVVLYSVVILNIGFLFEFLWALCTETTANAYSYTEFLSRHRFILIGAVMILPAILLDLLKFSHRVAGPLYRCRNAINQMSRGESVAEFKLRKHDLMSELFVAFNNLIRAWNTRIGSGADAQRREIAKACTANPQRVGEDLALVKVR